jgi:ABC-2 type transport system ATP-binding protein
MMNTTQDTGLTGHYAVETWGLTKRFKATRDSERMGWASAAARGFKMILRPPGMSTAVNGVSLSIRRGEFFGVIGSNGAGKTTLLKMLSGLLYPDEGGGAVNGYDLLRERASVRRSVVISKAQGWLGMLWQLTGYDNLMFRARMCGITRKVATERADYVLDRLGITHKAGSYSWEWSMGETQKFNLAATFIARTPLVILDEPTSHLDPHAARLIRDFVKQDLGRGNGQTVIMSTHYLEEADLLCDRVAVLHGGKVLACDTPSALKQTHVPERILEIRALNYTPAAGERAKQGSGATELLESLEDMTTGQARLRPKWSGSAPDADGLCRALEAEGVTIRSVNRVSPTLDDVYFHLTQEKIK